MEIIVSLQILRGRRRIVNIFLLITSFGRAFQAAIIDNTFQRTADASKSVEEKKESKSKTDGAKIATSGNKEGDSKPARRDNIWELSEVSGADVSRAYFRVQN